MPMNFPDTPTNGQTFTSGGVSWVWNGTEWNASTAPGGGGVSNVFIGDTAPANPVNGNLWWDSAPGIGQLFVCYNDGTSTQFVAANNTGGGLYLPLVGGTLTGALTLQSASLATVNYNNTTAPVAGGGWWRTATGPGGNWNLSVNTAAAGDFSTNVTAFYATPQGNVSIGNYAPMPSTAVAGHITGYVASFTNFAYNITLNSTPAWVLQTAGPALVLGLNSGSFQFWTGPSGAAGSVVTLTNIATINSVGGMILGGYSLPTGTAQQGQIVAKTFNSTDGQSVVTSNTYFTTSGGAALIATGTANAMNFAAGNISFYNAPSGNAGTTPSWTQMAALTPGGNLQLQGSYLTWVGASSAGVNGTSNGPLIYADQNAIVFHLGTGTNPNSITFQNNAGAQVLTVPGTGTAGSGNNATIIGNQSWYSGYASDNATAQHLLTIWGDNNIYLGENASPGRVLHLRGTTVSIEANVNSKGTGIMMAFHCWPSADNAYWCGYNGYQESWTGASSYTWVNASDGRNKRDIEELPLCLAIVNRLVPKRYKFNNAPPEDQGKTHWGFVAQDVEVALQGLECGAHRNDNGQHGVVYHELTAILWKAVQELSDELAELKERIH